jgi:EmrB/QacA subfamily drug resistance transporter
MLFVTISRKEMEYKWIVLLNTTLALFIASVDGTIVLISLPAIFRGIQVNPVEPSTFQYLLWFLMGYGIIGASFLVNFGRLSDIYGRVKLYNLGFVIFTIGSVLLTLTPNTGTIGALELVAFRIIEAIGATFLFANTTALLTDAFPPNERGKAMGMNQMSTIVGTILGLVLGGILAPIDWRLVFFVSVPIGIFGTIWSYRTLKETGPLAKGEKIDWVGNIVFATGLILILLGITYGLMPYGTSQTGWTDPYVIASLIAGAVLLSIFPFIERRVKYPMFKLNLFKIRSFMLGNLAQLLFAFSFGGLSLVLIILLQGIWLPLHGVPYSQTPFWAGIYLIPMSLGAPIMGPIAGVLSDKYGPRVFASLGLVILGVGFLALSTLPYNFNLWEFLVITFIMGMGMGMFVAPSTSAIMSGVPGKNRGAAAGMRNTLWTSAQTASFAIFFTIIISVLSLTLPNALYNAFIQAGAPQLGPIAYKIPVTAALFSAFLGYDPVKTLLSTLPPQVISSLSKPVIDTITSRQWFPQAIAPPFMHALKISFYISASLDFIAAVLSLFLRHIEIAE